MDKVQFIDVETQNPIYDGETRVYDMDKIPMKGDGVIIEGKKYKVLYRNFEYYSKSKSDSTITFRCIYVYLRKFDEKIEK